MKILAFSDLHLDQNAAAALLDAAAEADLVIGAGDFARQHQGLDAYMALFEPIAYKAVFVAGNNESVDELRAASSAVILHGEAGWVEGLQIFGLGYGVPVTPFGAWSCDLSEAEAAEMLVAAEGADLIISHSPPKGIADRTSAGLSIGSTALYAAIDKVQPKLVFCGHVHDSWGTEGLIGASRVVNLGPTVNWFEVDI